MKLKSSFVTHMSGKDQIMIDLNTSFSGIVRSNKTAAFIVDRLKEETSEAQILAAMEERYDAPTEKMAADLAKVLEKLRSIGAIEE